VVGETEKEKGQTVVTCGWGVSNFRSDRKEAGFHSGPGLDGNNNPED